MANFDRFKNAPWMTQAPQILIGGAGGIGSNTLYCLVRTIPNGRYYIVDFDTIAEHNVSTQFYKEEQIGRKKALAIKQNVAEYAKSADISPITTKMEEYCYVPIMIAAFDNMEARKYAFKLWKQRDNRELFIDGRLSATMYEVYCVIPGREESYEKTLFDDANVDEGPCTFRQTSHFGMLIGARITQLVTNFLTNRTTGQNICQLPFFIREVGDAVFVDIKSEADDTPVK